MKTTEISFLLLWTMGNTLFCVSYRFHIHKITGNCEGGVTIYGRKIKISKKKLRECETFSVNNVLEGLLW